MSVSVRAGSLFGFSDQISRDIGEFGVLVGTSIDGNTVVEFSFELKMVLNVQLDYNFAEKRLKQLRDVYSESEIVGVYQRRTPGSIEGADLALVINQAWSIACNGTNVDNFVFLFVSANEKPLKLKAYVVADGTIMVNQELDVHIVPSSIEQITTSTIMNNSNYSTTSSSGLSMDNVKTEVDAKDGMMSLSLNELEAKVEYILDYLKSIPPVSCPEEYELRGKILALIAHLCNKLDSKPSAKLLEEEEQDDKDKLLISKLGLLNSQVAALAKLREDGSRKVLKYGLLAQHYQG